VAGREINAKEVLTDIKSGMTDARLMKKYKISSSGLRDLLQQLSTRGLLAMSPVRKISMAEIIGDIRGGRSFSDLMHKYQLPPHSMQHVLDQLVDARAIRLDDLKGELFLRYLAIVPENVRQAKRHSVHFDVPFCIADVHHVRGAVRDISETGVGLTGIETEIDVIRQIIVLGDELGQIEPFELEVRCRWFKKLDNHCLSGYQITRIAQRDRSALERLIELADFGKCIQKG